MNRPRILVCGGGPVGLAIACAATGFDTCVLEAAAAPPALPSESFDLRVYALSPGTREFLRGLGAWERLDPARVTAVHRMEVFGDRGARLDFAGPLRQPVAWIVEAGRLQAALEAAARERGGTELRRGASAKSCVASAGGSSVELESGERLLADLLVGADGADSPLRRALGIAVDAKEYGESAIVAHFECERDHEGVARQWFRADGILAWLPLPGRQISIVWSAPEAVATELAGLEPEALAARVQEAGQGVLGAMRPASACGRFALRLIRVERIVAPGAALVGDAAHAVHPLAGQGVNLGFQDAKALALALRARSPLERPGDLRVLRRYARQRREEVLAMQWLTDGLDRLFAAPGNAPGVLRNLGLRLVDAQPWVKRALAARAMR